MELTTTYNLVSFVYADKADPDNVRIEIGYKDEKETCTIPLAEFFRMANMIRKAVEL